jgi:hypothetical protein
MSEQKTVTQIIKSNNFLVIFLLFIILLMCIAGGFYYYYVIIEGNKISEIFPFLAFLDPEDDESTPSPTPDTASQGGNPTPQGGNPTPQGGNPTPQGGNPTPPGGNPIPETQITTIPIPTTPIPTTPTTINPNRPRPAPWYGTFKQGTNASGSVKSIYYSSDETKVIFVGLDVNGGNYVKFVKDTINPSNNTFIRDQGNSPYLYFMNAEDILNDATSVIQLYNGLYNQGARLFQYDVENLYQAFINDDYSITALRNLN